MATSAAQRYGDLLAAIQDLRERGLYPAAQWAAEQLVGISPQPLAVDSQPSTSGRSARHPEDYHPLFLLAKSFFDMKEYRRAAFSLQTLQGAKARFLRNYSLYLAGERRKE
jgi:anaphase-promoting complex subunit 8